MCIRDRRVGSVLQPGQAQLAQRQSAGCGCGKNRFAAAGAGAFQCNLKYSVLLQGKRRNQREFQRTHRAAGFRFGQHLCFLLGFLFIGQLFRFFRKDVYKRQNVNSTKHRNRLRKCFFMRWLLCLLNGDVGQRIGQAHRQGVAHKALSLVGQSVVHTVQFRTYLCGQLLGQLVRRQPVNPAAVTGLAQLAFLDVYKRQACSCMA